MAQSSEYPDLKFVPPRAFGRGRDGKAVRYIVVHYTAGSERSTSAEDGAAYDQRRTDGTSTHYFVDSNSIVQCVRTTDRANAAMHRGNRLGIQYELCGTVQTRAQWLDPASDATLTNAARQIARDCIRYEIPVRRLSVAETRAAWVNFPNGPKGIVGHVDCTNAYPEDRGNHTDPGPQFPWDILLDRVQQFVAGAPAGSEDDMSWSDVTAILHGSTQDGWVDKTAPDWVRDKAKYNLAALHAKVDAIGVQLAAQKPAELVLTDEQVAQLATALVDDEDTPLGDADLAVIEHAVKRAIRDLVNPPVL